MLKKIVITGGTGRFGSILKNKKQKINYSFQTKKSLILKILKILEIILIK